MSTKRSAPRGQGRTQAPNDASGGPGDVQAGAKSTALEAVEEKVVRMRRGLAAPDDMPLGRVGLDHPATLAKLQAIEARAFERSGRLDELRREAGLGTATIDGATKDKIIAKLGKKPEAKAAKSTTPAKATKAAPATVKATAKAEATAKARPKKRS